MQQTMSDRRTYNKFLRSRIEQLTIQDFIPLSLSIVPKLQFRNPSVESIPQTLTSDEFISKARTQPTILIGPAGAGKTTLVIRIVERGMRSRKYTPIYVPLNDYRPSQSLAEYIERSCDIDSFATDALNDGTALVIWDGVNEVLSEDIDEIFARIIDFQAKHSRNQFVATCRSANFPTWCREKFETFSILPLDKESILEYLHNHLEPKFFQETIEVFVREDLSAARQPLLIFDSPLVLSMFLMILNQRLMTEFQISDLANRSAIYRTFVIFSRERDRAKRPQMEFEKAIGDLELDAILCDIGDHMVKNDVLTLTVDDAKAASKRRIDSTPERRRIWSDHRLLIDSTLEHLLTSFPIRNISSKVSVNRTITFFHQSFAEYFAALYIFGSEDENEKKKNVEFLLAQGKSKYWDVVRLLHDMSTASKRRTLRSQILSLAYQERQQEWLSLVVDLLVAEASVNADEIADIKLRLLEAFKNWGKPFDYGLIHALKRTMDELEPTVFERLENDCLRFVRKYSAAPPIALRYAELDDLFEDASSDSSNAIHAAYTIGKRATSAQDKVRAYEFIVRQFSKASDDIKVQLMSSIRDLEYGSSFEFIASVVKDHRMPTMARVFGLNAASVIASSVADSLIIEYLETKNNRYRDSACWSLQYCARDPRNSKKQERYKRVFWSLANEIDPNSSENCFLRGNAFYSLGVIGAVEYVDEIKELLRAENDPYVIEDMILSLQLMESAIDASEIIQLSQDKDLGIRLRIAEHVAKSGNMEDVRRQLAEDRILAIRQAAVRSVKP